MTLVLTLGAIAAGIIALLIVRARRRKAHKESTTFYACRQCEHPYFIPNVPLRCRRCEGPVDKIR